MANTYECPNPVRGLASRWTRADVCGRPLARHSHSKLRVTTRAFVMAKFSMDLEKGTEIVQKRADGSLCVSDLAPDQLKRLAAEVQMCGMPVPLQQIALSMNAFVDPSNPSHIIGAALPSIDQKAAIEATETLQVEMWQFNKNSAACAAGGALPGWRASSRLRSGPWRRPRALRSSLGTVPASRTSRSPSSKRSRRPAARSTRTGRSRPTPSTKLSSTS
jgi:hypothetical protein